MLVKFDSTCDNLRDSLGLTPERHKELSNASDELVKKIDTGEITSFAQFIEGALANCNTSEELVHQSFVLSTLRDDINMYIHYAKEGLANDN